VPASASPRDFRFVVDENRLTGKLSFGGFNKCIAPCQWFWSDAERRFAVLLEDSNDLSIVKWVRPGRDALQLCFGEDFSYGPDFVVETKRGKLLCDIREASDIGSVQVQENAKAASKWCEYATAQESVKGGKPWSQLLVPPQCCQRPPLLGDLENPPQGYVAPEIRSNVWLN